jgi:site-specific DNA-methyltransferase (adenine-specific)
MKLKRSTCVLGDALEVLGRLPTGSFDACIVDPPYNMSKKKGLGWAFSKHVTMQESWDRFSKEEYFGFSYRWISEVCRVVKPNGNLFLFGTYHNIYTLGFILQQLDRKVLNSIVWVKPNAQPNITCRMLTESSEQMVWACNNSNKDASKWTFNYQDAKTFNEGKQLRNVWTMPVTPRKERVAGHPSQKPLALLERVVLIGTRPEDWVLDPFSGVGTTAAAAHKHGRKFLMVEKLSRYHKAQKDRFALLENPGTIDFIRAADIKAPMKTKNPKPLATATP